MPVAPIVKEVTIPEMILVSDLAQKMSVKAALVIKHLMKLGIMATINQSIDQETAAIWLRKWGIKPSCRVTMILSRKCWLKLR